MTPGEFFDKENGTTFAAPGARTLSDSDRNIMADLAGEADEPCFFCEEPVRPDPNPFTSRMWEFTVDDDGEIPCHEECFDEAKEAAEMAKAEEIYRDKYPYGRGPGR